MRQAAIELTPRYDQIALAYLAGKKNYEIAELVGVSLLTVSKALADPRMIEFIEQARSISRTNLKARIEDKLVYLASRSLDNLAQTVEAKISPLNVMKRHQDGVGLELLKMIGYERVAQSPSAGTTLPPQLAERLTQALEKAERAARIPVETGPIVDAEIVEEGKESAPGAEAAAD